MDGEAGEEEAGRKALVIDTNVIISSMLRETGYTRKVLIVLATLYPTYTPRYAIEEIHKHTLYLAEEKGIPREKQDALLEMITRDIIIVNEEWYREYIQAARQLVEDPGDIDFVALSLKLRIIYREVAIVTWNMGDYRKEALREKGISVLTPKEAAKSLLPSTI